MNSEKLFQILSYAAVFFGFLALWISGVFGLFGTILFLAAFACGWLIEGSKRQVSERLGTVLIVLALPIYYLLWRAGFFLSITPDSELPGILARLIVTLSAIKILQKKSDRDWIFLYLMSFFEVLLAAGLSISLLYFLSFVAYIFVMVSAVILFEIRKTGRAHLDLDRSDSLGSRPVLPARRLPATSVVLIIFMVAFAAPMFFLLPRVGGAGFGGSERGGVHTASGFSDTVTLGGIGNIQLNDEIVMRIRVDGRDPGQAGDLRWRGVALDTFGNLSWRKSRPGYPERMPKGDRDIIPLDVVRGRDGLVQQTIYLEPINSAVLFVLPRALAVQGPMSHLNRDRSGSIRYESRGERISYRVFSETSIPDASVLRRDNGNYDSAFHNYLQVPEDLDPRIGQLASRIAANTSNRFDTAQAVEAYLQSQFGYTLEQKAGGDQPLSDFLFNIREGHCEYFASAMAIMLRTQGIATRVVNGFQRGEYNDTADVFVVRQRNAHSWVEVYFPGTDTWITFDPTPASGQNLTAGTGGITKRINNYLEALETFWIQYFVAYDSAEQRSLITSVRRSVVDYGRQTSSLVDGAREALLAWWSEVRGDAGLSRSLWAVGFGVAILLGIGAVVLSFAWLYRRLLSSRIWQRLRARFFGRSHSTIIAFYERMLMLLASKGLVRQPHQTPLEFAYLVGDVNVIKLTELYNSVRFGNTRLTKADVVDIESSLEAMQK